MVSIENFRPYSKSDIAVDLGSTVQLEVRLELAGMNESVTVTKDATQVETSDTRLGQVIESKQVTGLPLNGRSYTDLRGNVLVNRFWNGLFHTSGSVFRQAVIPRDQRFVRRINISCPLLRVIF
jgi:hypothetical protein